MFEQFVEDHKEEMIRSLQGLLQIPSVKDASSPGKPFGAQVGASLDFVLELAHRYGFVTENVDGFAGHVEYGEGDDYIAVLSHLDVVPAGSGWTYPPFAAEIHDEKIYARGAIDDKGPAMSSMWALIALKQAGIMPKRKIRLIFGLDEESDWQCMAHYFSKQPMPLGGFTPDADFPLIFAEKGLTTIRYDIKADADAMNPRVIQFEGGHRVNMVPDYAMATVDCYSETAALEWEQKLRKETHQRQIECDLDVNGDHIRITVHGVSAHGSTPDLGVNAIVQLATLISCQPVANGTMWRAIAAQDTAGKNLGIEAADEITGSLTSNLGRAYLENGSYVFLFNIRYPVDVEQEELLRRSQAYVSDKWKISFEENMPPLYVPKDSAVVQSLLEVYETYTGDTVRPLAIGGATYARAIPNAVAFGALFPGQPDVAHQKDEYWSLVDYFKCVQIYAHAMLNLANIL
jgi:succinyl-diaminopimelate desuccinylase